MRTILLPAAALAALLALAACGSGGGTATNTPATATPDTTTVSTDAPSTLVWQTSPAPATLGPLLSITAQGDAVRVAADGSQTLLYDGPSPGTGEEGPTWSVDAVAVTSDGAVLVSTCREPSPGSLLRLPGAGAPADTTVFGHSVALSDDETLVAFVTIGAIQIGTAELAPLSSLDCAAEGLVSDGLVIDDIVWIGDRRLAVVGRDTDGGWLRSFTVGVGTPLVAAAEARLDVPTGGGMLSFAGGDASVLHVVGVTPDQLTAFDGVSLSRTPVADISLEGDPISAHVDNGVVSWIDRRGILHIGAEAVVGTFVWVGGA